MKKLIIALGCISAISHASANPSNTTELPTCASNVRISSVSVGDLDSTQWSLGIANSDGMVRLVKSKHSLGTPMGETLLNTAFMAMTNHEVVDLKNCTNSESGFKTIKIYSDIPN